MAGKKRRKKCEICRSVIPEYKRKYCSYECAGKAQSAIHVKWYKNLPKVRRVHDAKKTYEKNKALINCRAKEKRLLSRYAGKHAEMMPAIRRRIELIDYEKEWLLGLLSDTNLLPKPTESVIG